MSEMQHIEQQVIQVKDQISQVDTKVSSVLTLLQGNALDKEDKGMIGSINDMERRITTLEDLWKKGKWLFIGLGITSGWGAIDMIQKIFLK